MATHHGGDFHNIYHDNTFQTMQLVLTELQNLSFNLIPLFFGMTK